MDFEPKKQDSIKDRIYDVQARLSKVGLPISRFHYVLSKDEFNLLADEMIENKDGDESFLMKLIYAANNGHAHVVLKDGLLYGLKLVLSN